MATNKLEADALAIFNRYNGDIEKFVKNSTDEEWRQVMKYLRPEIEETLKMSLPIIAKYIFEDRIYPLVLYADSKDEDKDLVDALDMIYEELTEPNLFAEFKEELKTFGPEDTISPELGAKFRIVDTRTQELKQKIRKRLRKEEEEEKRLLAEETK